MMNYREYRVSSDGIVDNSSTIGTSYCSSSQSFLIPPRLDMPEFLDIGVGSVEDVKANFADMWRINRYLGGLRALTLHLYPRLLAHEDPVNLVDLGTGAAHIAVAIRQWAQQHQLELRLHGLELSARNLAVANSHHFGEERVKLIQADALKLPFKKGTVDYFISSLFLHHLSPEQVIELLAHTFEAARKGIVMSDLVRGWLPILGFKFGQPIFARNFLTRHDGVVSIQRAYIPSELLHLAQAAGITHARVYTHWPWRMTLVADK